MLSHGVPQSLVTATDATGKTALFFVIREAARPLKDHPDSENDPDPAPLVEKLLSAKADPFQSDFYGWNALHLAARFSTPKTVHALLKNGGDPLRDGKDAEERSPLYRAIKHENKFGTRP